MKTVRNQSRNGKLWIACIFLLGSAFFYPQCIAQQIQVKGKYHSSKVDDWPIEYSHTATFRTKEEAIYFHKVMLDLNGIDTSKTSVEYGLDAPIFSSFLHENDEELAIVTYVRKNSFGRYTSCFLECKNVTFDLFESDGYMLTQNQIEK
jgi:hypothetical protein